MLMELTRSRKRTIDRNLTLTNERPGRFVTESVSQALAAENCRGGERFRANSVDQSNFIVSCLDSLG
jgi:hypothetical protein